MSKTSPFVNSRRQMSVCIAHSIVFMYLCVSLNRDRVYNVYLFLLVIGGRNEIVKQEQQQQKIFSSVVVVVAVVFVVVVLRRSFSLHLATKTILIRNM